MKAISLLLRPRLAFVAALFVLPAAVVETRAAERHCLWKVEGPKTTVHLLGSVHLLKKTDYPLAAPIEKAFEQAKVVCFETDIEAMESPKTQMGLLAKGQLPPGQTLKDLVSKETYEMLAAHLKKAGVPAGTFDQFKPWFVGIGLLGLELPKLGLDPEYGVDKHYHTRAREAGKTVIPLEPLEFQINLLATLDKEGGEEFLQSTLKDISNIRKMLTDLVQAWRQGDASKLDTILNDALTEHPRIYKRFLTDRNKRWVVEIEKLLQGDKPAMVIVGAGHMVGKESVVELLEKKGFKVTQQ